MQWTISPFCQSDNIYILLLTHNNKVAYASNCVQMIEAWLLTYLKKLQDVYCETSSNQWTSAFPTSILLPCIFIRPMEIHSAHSGPLFHLFVLWETNKNLLNSSQLLSQWRGCEVTGAFKSSADYYSIVFWPGRAGGEEEEEAEGNRARMADR